MKFFTSREISSSSRPHLSSRLSQLSRETFLTALAALAGGDPQRAHSYSLYTVVYLISVQYYTKSYSISLQTLSHDIHNIYTCTTCTTCTLVLLLHILHIHMLVHLHSYGTCILYIHSHCIYSHCIYSHGIHCSWITLCFCINNKYCNLLYN